MCDRTPLYTCPFQEEGATLDPKVDSFSLGVVLLELFRPFDTTMERVTVIIDHDAPGDDDVRIQVLRELATEGLDAAAVLRMCQDVGQDGAHLAHVAELVAQLVCSSLEDRLCAADLLTLLPRAVSREEGVDKGDHEEVEQLRRNARTLEDDMQILRVESDKKSEALERLQAKIDQLLDERLELDMDLKRKGQQVIQITCLVAPLFNQH